MRRLLCGLLCLPLLFGLFACDGGRGRQTYLQPFDFYYRAAQTDYASPYGPIGVETRDLGEAALSNEALLSLYLQGPRSADLVSPFPPNVELRGVSSSATLLTVHLGSAYDTLQGVDASLADACLVKTALGLANIRSVRIVVEDEDGTVLRSAAYDSGDILLADTRTDAERREITLYFADAEGLFLLSEKRSAAEVEPDRLPQYVTELLLAGPQTAGLYPTIPAGTSVLDVNVENGVCAVDLSAEFTAPRADNALAPHLTLLSLANTLTELDGIDQVQLYVEGRQSGCFGPFPLTAGYTAESRAVGPSHPELSEQECTLLLPVTEEGLLYPLTLRVRSGSNESAQETLLRVLFSYGPQNGLVNPWFNQSAPLAVSMENGVCRVLLSQPLPGQDEAEQELALRVLIATLCAREDIRSVTVLDETGAARTVAAPEAEWYWQTPEG